MSSSNHRCAHGGPEKWRGSFCLGPFPLILSMSLQKRTCSPRSQVAFFNSALASADEEQARLRGQLKEQKLHCRRLAQLAAPSQHQLEGKAPAPHSGGNSVPAETHQALQGAMDKLQVSESPRAVGQGGPGWAGQGAAEPQPFLSAAGPLYRAHAGESGLEGARRGAGASLHPAVWRDGHYW